MTNVGFRILPLENRVSNEMIDEYREFVTPNISDNMNRINGVDASLRPIHTHGTMVGSAFTVKTRPGDNLMVHKAIDMAQPGDVIVVDAGGELTNAIMGEIMVRIARKNGIEGFVINGAIRDSKEIREMNYPMYAKGVIHRGPYKDGPGEINVPIQLGGVVVNPGDLVVADMDGIVIVPFDHVGPIADKVRITMEMEKNQMEQIEARTIDRTWVDEMLRKKGCEGV
ncbi:putative dimethylmenaquinone methyltransferase (plasmid) [Alkalihalophilus pseudofirmus OF4]|uniref:Putative 4-hydroxy-4-methyl-2-oxoglutarate aldolase n=1 Tax=Alkalihalophilus pseudofirmus (strain ATCC BAA-2126 / JCM 17055 / OF4) TaxID=398511 RepID=D3G1S5_ALKPO|nr:MULTISPECIES: RraA family protein [Alkalihalophilus]ADC52301.1 putative dimethylmenaquinone methyltransferase [Alkalihalophilus pseudofirmus OF4]MED1603310.1 RraA family protein [Alkalihalophilus marmarensis]